MTPLVLLGALASVAQVAGEPIRPTGEAHSATDAAEEPALVNGAKDAPAFKPYNPGWIGTTARTGPLLTKTLLFQGEGPHRPGQAKKVLRAWDKATGAVVAEVALPDHTLGPPMTCMAGGRQFIVCGMGFRGTPHRLVALALPKEKTT